MIMDTGLRFKQIMDDVAKQSEAKFDFNVSARSLRMGGNGNIYSLSKLATPDFEGSAMTDWAMSQLCLATDIPKRFAQKIPGDLRAQNFNYFLERFPEDKQFFVRSYSSGGSEKRGPLLRGFLSTDYAKFDDDLFMEMVGKCIGTENDHKILMSYRDDRGMHLRVGFPDLQADIGRLRDGSPDRHMVGMHIMNSEVGQKSVVVAPMVYRLVCTNGLMRWVDSGDAFRQRHVFLKESEMFNRVAEAIGGAANAGNEMVEEIRAIREFTVDNPLDVIKRLSQDRKYSAKLTDSIVTSFHEEPGESQFHVVQAFTRAARNLQGDERVELERDASHLLKRRLQKEDAVLV